jgi:MFS family permease
VGGVQELVGLAVSVHVLGMFAPSVATGWLADRVGGAAVAWAGFGTLCLAAAAVATVILAGTRT